MTSLFNKTAGLAIMGSGVLGLIGAFAGAAGIAGMIPGVALAAVTAVNVGINSLFLYGGSKLMSKTPS